MSRPCCLLDPGQGHVHREDPVPILVQSLVVGHLRFGMVSEDRRAAGLLSGPFPGIVASRELMDTDVALTVKEVRAVLLARGGVAGPRKNRSWRNARPPGYKAREVLKLNQQCRLGPGSLMTRFPRKPH